MNVKLNAKKKHKAKDTGKSHYSFWLQRFPPLGKKTQGGGAGATGSTLLLFPLAKPLFFLRII
jgi:hypothetical protein